MSNPKINNTLRKIDVPFVRHLVASQFPQWKDLPIKPVPIGGWDNRTFHLGNHMLIRMPSAVEYAGQVEKEHYWLPKLAPLLPLAIPEPLAIGDPTEKYPWKWSVYRWLEGDTVASTPILDLCNFAVRLTQFLTKLQHIDPAGGPPPGTHNFFRGGSLITYDTETRQAISILQDKIDRQTATEIWEMALKTTWQNPPVWVHGDLTAGNVLIREGQLSAVIDFGLMAVGDPACDLSIAWTFFRGESRELFRTMLSLDPDTWSRGRAWTLWKALVVAAGLIDLNTFEAKASWRIIHDVIEEHKHNR